MLREILTLCSVVIFPDVATNVLIWSNSRGNSTFKNLKGRLILSPVTLILMYTSSGLMPFFSPSWQTENSLDHRPTMEFWFMKKCYRKTLALMSWISIRPSFLICLCRQLSWASEASSFGLSGRAGTRLTGEGGLSFTGRGAGSGRATSHMSHIVAGE